MSTEQLYKRVARILEQARSQVARTVNTAMVHAYWQVGRESVEVEQAGKAHAGYGDDVIEQLSARLVAAYGRGFSVRNLWSMRQFSLTFLVVLRMPGLRRQRLQNLASSRRRPGLAGRRPRSPRPRPVRLDRSHEAAHRMSTDLERCFPRSWRGRTTSC